MSLDLTPALPEDRQLIQSYGDGQFHINDQVHAGPVLLLPTRALAWPVSSRTLSDPNNIQLSDFELVIEEAEGFDILLLGCGKSACLLSADIKEHLKKLNIVPEAMDTGAACRTFNVLQGDGRQVAAALLPVD